MTDYDRYSDLRDCGRSHLGLALTFLFIGLGAGAAVALVLAPKSGKQMRRSLRRKYEDAREAIDDIGDQAGDILEKGAEWATYAKEKVEPLGRVIRKR